MRRARGFTLIEVVVATTLLAILMVMAIAGIRTITRATAAGSAAIDRSTKLRVTQEFLRRELMQALAVPFEQEGTTGRIRDFLGTPERMVFVAPMPGYLGKGGPYVQELKLARADGGQRLEFRHALLNGYLKDDAKKVEEGEPVVLLEGIERVEFSYRGLGETGQLEDWRDSWERYGVAPLLVRIRIEFPREDRRSWPDFVVPLMLDPATGRTVLAPRF